jgi:hypothetical protein
MGDDTPDRRWREGSAISTEPLSTHAVAGVDESERGLLIAVLVMVILGAVAMFFMSA